MSTPSFSNQTEKNFPAFWWFYTTWDEEFFHRPILCLAAQILRCGLCFGRRKNINLHPQAKALIVFLAIVGEIL